MPDERLPGMESAGDTWPGGYRVTRDPAHEITHFDWRGDSRSTFSWGTEISGEELHYEVSDAFPAVSSVRGAASIRCELKGRTVDWHVELDLQTDAKTFYFRFMRTLVEGGRVLRTKTWKETIPRDFR